MKVQKIEWICQDSQEAFLKISGNGDVYCEGFSHPCQYKQGDEISKPLLSVGEKAVIRTTQIQKDMISKDSSPFGHFIVAKVIDSNNSIVEVEGIKIQLSAPLPGDIEVGQQVSFYTSRLDVP